MTIVPVIVLFQLNLSQNQGSNNLLTWQTASENNNKGFKIERSANGRVFDEIGFEKGNGTTSEKLSYSFIDEHPLSISYYRLKQVDFSGKESLSKVVSVIMNVKEGFKIFPNPTSDIVNVQFNSIKNAITQLEMYDNVGRLVYQYQFETKEGFNHMLLNTNSFAKGIYTLKIKHNNTEMNEKIVIQ